MSHYKYFAVILSVALMIAGCGKKEDAQSGNQAASQQQVTSQDKTDAAPVQQAVKRTDQAAPSKNVTATTQAERGQSEYPVIAKAADFELQSIDGSTVRLSDFKGKVVILDFWATWCPPCLKMIPELKQVYSKYRDKGVEVVGISLDEGGLDVVKRFTENARIEYPVLLGNREVSDQYGSINAIPTSFIIDREGMIRNKHTGYRDAENMEKVIVGITSQQ